MTYVSKHGKHDPHADGRRILERVEQWKKDNPTSVVPNQEGQNKQREEAFKKAKGPAFKKGLEVFRWNGVSKDRGIVLKKTKKYVYVDWGGVEERIEAALFTYQMSSAIDNIEWSWNAPSVETEQTFVTKIEGDWEKTYDHTDKCVSMKILTTNWCLRPPYDFLIDEGYNTVTEENAKSLEYFIEGKWPDTYYWFWGACHDKKHMGDEVIKWMIGALKEFIYEKIGLKFHYLKFHASDFGELVAAVVDKRITSTMGKEVLTRMHNGEHIEELLKDDKYKVSSDDDIIAFIRDVIEANPEQIAELKEGKDKILGWLVGQVMKASKGKANAGEVNKMFREELEL